MNQLVFLAIVMGLSLSGCAKKKTAEKNLTQRQTLEQIKKADLLAKAKAKEVEEAQAKAKAEADTVARAEAEAKAKEDEQARKKKEEEQAAKDKLNKDVIIAPPAEVSPAPVAEQPKAVKPEEKKPAVKSGQTSSTQAQAQAESGTPADIDEKVKKVGGEALQKLTEKAQAAEKSDMKKIKPGSPEADWEKVVNFVSEKGKFDEVAGGLESYLSLDEFSSANLNEPYNRKMISLVGGRDGQGNFGFSRVHAVDEDWSKDKDGNNVGLLYQFLLGRDGSLAKVNLVKLVKKSTGSEHVIEHRGLDLSEADGKARWEANRQYWVKKVVRNK